MGDLQWAETRYRSARGMILSNWRIENDIIYLEVEVPVNARAEVIVPSRSTQEVAESGGPASEATGVKSRPMARKNTASFELGSGRYHFTAPL